MRKLERILEKDAYKIEDMSIARSRRKKRTIQRRKLSWEGGSKGQIKEVIRGHEKYEEGGFQEDMIIEDNTRQLRTRQDRTTQIRIRQGRWLTDEH